MVGAGVSPPFFVIHEARDLPWKVQRVERVIVTFGERPMHLTREHRDLPWKVEALHA